MRIVLKIIVAPFVLVLMLAVAVISFLSCIAGAVCWLACIAFTLLGIFCLFGGLHTGCIVSLVIAFLVSPLGSQPSGSGCWSLYGAKYALQDFMVS